MNCCVRNADHNSSSWFIPHYQYLLNEPPRNLLNNNPIILLITLENNKDIKVRTYFFLDTGSSFGCISPMTIAKLLKVNSIKNIHGTTIKTCKKGTVIDRTVVLQKMRSNWRIVLVNVNQNFRFLTSLLVTLVCWKMYHKIFQIHNQITLPA